MDYRCPTQGNKRVRALSVTTELWRAVAVRSRSRKKEVYSGKVVILAITTGDINTLSG